MDKDDIADVMALAKEIEITKAVNKKLDEHIRKTNPRLLKVQWKESYSQADASEYIPVAHGCRIVKEDKRSFFWQCYYPTCTAPFSHTKTWNLERSEKEAMIQVIQWAWDAHGKQCPYDLHSMVSKK